MKVIAKEIQKALNTILADKNDTYCKELWNDINNNFKRENKQFTIILTITKDFNFEKNRLFEVHADFGKVTF